MSCPGISEIEVSEWGQSLLDSLGGRRYPLGGTLEMTDRCNLSCVHCYINQPAASRDVKKMELTSAQVKQILDQIVEAGCLFLLLTGGEVLVRPDFPEIYRHAKQRGLIVSIFTNGTMVTPRVANLLAEQRPHSIEITLYGATAETYDMVTGVPGSFEHCLHGIRLLLERGLPLSLKSVLVKENLPELDLMRSMANELGVSFRYDGTLWPRLDGGTQPFNHRLTAEDLITLDLADPERQREWTRTAETFAGKPTRNEFLYSCGAGMHTFHIDSSGRLSICTMSRRPNANILELGFQRAWEMIGDLRQEKRKYESSCLTCKVGALCFQCPGWSQTIHGDDETTVDFVCELGHLRFEQTQQAHV